MPQTKLYSQSFLTRWIPHPPPMTKPPKYSKEAEKEIPRFTKRHINEMKPRYLYELALLNIKIGQYDEAERLLYQTIKENPDFVDARIQLGYLSIWEDEYENAYQQFLWLYDQHGCTSKIQTGLRLIGTHWVKNNINHSKSLDIFENLYECDPNHGDTILYLGLLFYKTGQKANAEIYLKKSLELNPNNVDADVTLGYLYASEGRVKKARTYFEKHPNDCEAILGLARLKQTTAETRESHAHYIEALKKCPDHGTIRLEAARIATSSRKFNESAQHYDLYMSNNPLDFRVWEESQITKSYTHQGLLLDVSYTSAKENDPVLNVPVVRDFYTYASIHSTVPVNDALRFEFKGFFYNQKEINIINYGLNYDADLSGGEARLEYLFKDHFRLNAFARALGVWQQEDDLSPSFPFQNTWNFEPGITLEYKLPIALFYFDAHIESFITKNFNENSSILIPLGSEEVYFLFRPDIYLSPDVETSITLKELWDNNFEPVVTIRTRCNLPLLEKYFTFQYVFEYSKFKFLTPNYFSYDHQYWQFAELDFHCHLFKNLHFKAVYEFNWQITKNLIQPIGDFLNITEMQSLTGNKISCHVTYRYVDHLRFVLKGHYYRNTLIYRDWDIKGSLLFQF